MARAISCSSRWNCSRSSRRSRRRSHQTAPHEDLPPERVTVTLPVHPFCGMALVVVRHERDQRGRRYVTAAHPTDGGNLRLPVEWTDRSAPRPAPRVNGQEVRIRVDGLLALAGAVDVARRRKLDLPTGTPAPSAQAGQPDSPLDLGASRRGVRSVGGDTARPARGVGVPGAKSPATPRRIRRGAR